MLVVKIELSGMVYYLYIIYITYIAGLTSSAVLIGKSLPGVKRQGQQQQIEGEISKETRTAFTR